ncbi:MAG: single-strand binding protein single-strand DNA-binding protein [Patescibacteria group bacterium]|nr:single-strand binding protein single-strand DNA-binding protein [Patescibacteria group bacterium]
MYINKVILYGNLTRDPELKALPSGNKVVNFSIATNRTWKDAAGKKQEAAEYHNIVFYGKLAETIAQYMRKGSTLLVEGRLTTRSWDGADGQKRYRTEIVGEEFQFGPRPATGGSFTSGGTGVYHAPESSGGAQPKDDNVPDVDTIEYPSDDINPEDIPF